MNVKMLLAAPTVAALARMVISSLIRDLRLVSCQSFPNSSALASPYIETLHLRRPLLGSVVSTKALFQTHPLVPRMCLHLTSLRTSTARACGISVRTTLPSALLGEDAESSLTGK